MTEENHAPAQEEVAPAEEEPKQSRSALLEDEGEIAADYLEEFLDIADIDGDIDIDVVGGRAQVAIVNDDDDEALAPLVGKGASVLSALQELTRLAVQTSTGSRSWLMLDIAGYRDDRRASVQRRAQEAISSVKESQEAVSLAPMNAFERKIVHDEVASAGLRSESEGEDDSRHVIIHPA